MRRVLVLAKARTGSTPFIELLASHPQIEVRGEAGELLNIETQQLPTGTEALYDYVDAQLAAITKKDTTAVAFKLFPDHLLALGLRLDDLVHHCGIETIIVVWRENIVESAVSELIARATGSWHSMTEASKTERIGVEPEKLKELIEDVERDWATAFASWPIEIPPIFVQFEQLFASDTREDINTYMAPIFHQIGVRPYDWAECYAKRQNPAPMAVKVTNWSALPKELQQTTISVPNLLHKAIGQRFGLPSELIAAVVPDREPSPPTSGSWAYRVAEPYLPPSAVQFVQEALETNSVSSAGVWPQRLTTRLKTIFGVSVAQPCCNGFSALVLALQSAGINTGCDVIVPTFTMVAVPNAVRFVGGHNVFVDCATADGYNPSWTQIEAAATDATKAVIIAHTFGVPADDIELIAAKCKEKRWTLIEDISECVGIKIMTTNGSRLLGTFGDYACASMYANKVVQAGDGGFVLAKDPKRGCRLTSLTNHGFTKSFHFVHFESAINAKINGLGAALACGCLDQLNYIITHRAHVAQQYRAHLAATPLRLMPQCGVGDTPWVFGVQCRSKQERTALRQFLATNGIETRDFFFPLHLQPAFAIGKDENSKIARLPNSEAVSSTGFYLPTHSNLTDDAISAIASTVRAYFGLGTIKPEIANISQVMDAKSKQETRANSAGNNSLQSSKKNTQENDANKSSSVDLKSRPEQLLKRARLCFQGDECWDEKEALISKIEKYLSKQNDTTGKTEHQLKAYSEYFQTTGTLESVPIEGTLANDCSAFQRAVDALGKMPKIIVVLGAAGETIDNMSNFIENEKFDTKVFFVAKNSSKFRQEKPMDTKKMSILEENGLTFHTTIARNSVDLLCIDCDHISINKIGPVWNDLVEYLLTENAAILLTNLNEHHLAFLTKVAGCFDIISKRDNIRLYRRRLVMKMTTDTPYEEVQKLWNTPLPRKLRFEENPDWEHHHKNAFTSSIDALRNKLGNDNAEVLFIPAVEQFMCDSQATPVQPWIGIIHGVIDSNEHFYVPDLRKLCTQQRYQPWLRQCRGLITLTTDQAQFLKANLQDKYGMPIVSVKYPFTAIERSLTATKSTAAEIWKSTGSVDVYFIGSFDRDFQHFFQAQLPDGARKALLLGDWRAQLITIPDDVIRAERATDDEYERILSESVVFLSLKQGGAANTTVLECIARNTPIIAPRVASVEEYLGKDYPLFYEQGALDFQHILTPDRIEKAATYLRSMDKTSLAADHFIDSIEKSTVLASLAPYKTDARQFTITIAICSYKRTHHLRNILDSLWNKQTYQGNYEIIVWNNNRNRQKTVADICGEFMTKNCPQKQLELIQSSENHYCAVRFAMPQLMRSERLLICDDDVVPGSDFIQFFIDAHHRHPTDVLCIRGQYFLPHKMNDIDPHQVWITYDHVRFVDDQAEERLIHYVHADVCLIPKLALHEIASIPLPHDDFKLVDDYWMSYVLSAQFERRLRKLKIAENVLERMSDSDEIGLALHTRPEVSNARTRVYIEHMCHGWPQFDRPQPYYDAALAAHKKRAWDKYRLGMNVNSEITDSDIVVLKELGVGFVRVGAVGVGRDQSFEFSELNADYKQQMVQTSSLIERLARNGIDVVIVLDRRLATAENWRRLADCCAKFKNVIGYDLINEPFTDQNNDQHWYEMKPLEPDDQEKLFEMYRTLIEGVRSSDLVTPVIIETPFWASISTLDHLPIAKLKQVEANLIVSIHYYEPQLLTWRYQNKNRFAFPGPVPIYDQCGPMSETIDWSHDYIAKRFDLIRSWIKETEVPVFVGEFGICRDTVGADQYLEAVVDSCKRLNLVGCFYAFRDPDWEAMDYELGTDISNEHQRTIKGNHFMELIKNSCANDFASVTKNE